MRSLIILLICVFQTSFSYSQNDSITLADEFERIVGEWDGSFEFTTSEDGKETMSMPAKCSSTWDGSKWVYEVQYDEGEGLITGGKGNATVTDNQKTLNYNGLVWNVIELSESGDTTTILLEIVGKEKRKVVTTRQKIIVTSTTFSITETSKSDGDPAFIFRTRHNFRRVKGK